MHPNLAACCVHGRHLTHADTAQDGMEELMPPSDRLDPMLLLKDPQECTALHLAVLRGEPMSVWDCLSTKPNSSSQTGTIKPVGVLFMNLLMVAMWWDLPNRPLQQPAQPRIMLPPSSLPLPTHQVMWMWLRSYWKPTHQLQATARTATAVPCSTWQPVPQPSLRSARQQQTSSACCWKQAPIPLTGEVVQEPPMADGHPFTCMYPCQVSRAGGQLLCADPDSTSAPNWVTSEGFATLQ